MGLLKTSQVFANPGSAHSILMKPKMVYWGLLGAGVLAAFSVISLLLSIISLYKSNVATANQMVSNPPSVLRLEPIKSELTNR